MRLKAWIKKLRFRLVGLRLEGLGFRGLGFRRGGGNS